MPYAIRIGPAAERDIRRLDKQNKLRILDRLEELRTQPRPPGVEKLKGKGAEAYYRIRSGDYRVIYAIEDDKLIVLVLKVGNRREVYRRY